MSSSMAQIKASTADGKKQIAYTSREAATALLTYMSKSLQEDTIDPNKGVESMQKLKAVQATTNLFTKTVKEVVPAADRHDRRLSINLKKRQALRVPEVNQLQRLRELSLAARTEKKEPVVPIERTISKFQVLMDKVVLSDKVVSEELYGWYPAWIDGPKVVVLNHADPEEVADLFRFGMIKTIYATSTKVWSKFPPILVKFLDKNIKYWGNQEVFVDMEASYPIFGGEDGKPPLLHTKSVLRVGKSHMKYPAKEDTAKWNVNHRDEERQLARVFGKVQRIKYNNLAKVLYATKNLILLGASRTPLAEKDWKKIGLFEKSFHDLSNEFAEVPLACKMRLCKELQSSKNHACVCCPAARSKRGDMASMVEAAQERQGAEEAGPSNRRRRAEAAQEHPRAEEAGPSKRARRAEEAGPSKRGRYGIQSSQEGPAM